MYVDSVHMLEMWASSLNSHVKGILPLQDKAKSGQKKEREIRFEGLNRA